MAWIHDPALTHQGEFFATLHLEARNFNNGERGIRRQQRNKVARKQEDKVAKSRRSKVSRKRGNNGVTRLPDYRISLSGTV